MAPFLLILWLQSIAMMFMRLTRGGSAGAWWGYGLVAYGIAIFQSPKTCFRGRNFQEISASEIQQKSDFRLISGSEIWKIRTRKHAIPCPQAFHIPTWLPPSDAAVSCAPLHLFSPRGPRLHQWMITGPRLGYEIIQVIVANVTWTEIRTWVCRNRANVSDSDCDFPPRPQTIALISQRLTFPMLNSAKTCLSGNFLLLACTLVHYFWRPLAIPCFFALSAPKTHDFGDCACEFPLLSRNCYDFKWSVKSK